MVRIAPAEFAHLDEGGITLIFPIEVTNPYGSELTLTGVDYRIRSAGKLIASDGVKTRELVQPQVARFIRVPVELEFADLKEKTSETVAAGSVAPFEADLVLELDVPGYESLELPLKTTGELPLSVAPELALESIRWNELSLAKASATLQLHVWNRNDFPIELSRISYSLVLGGVSVVHSILAEAVPLAPSADRTIDLETSFSPQRFGLAFFNILTGSGATYELAGTMGLTTPFGSTNLPYRKSGQAMFRQRQSIRADSPILMADPAEDRD